MSQTPRLLLELRASSVLEGNNERKQNKQKRNEEGRNGKRERVRKNKKK